MELQSSVLSVNILDVRVAAIGLRWVKFWLLTGQSSLDMLFTDAIGLRWVELGLLGCQSNPFCRSTVH
jgi:hypothetical protein